MIKPLHHEKGITLVIGMIMLVALTLIVTAAFTLSNTNLKAVANMQARGEAIAAANVAIEQVLSSAFTASPGPESINVDLDNDGTVDYVVDIATPLCVSASRDSTPPKSSASLPVMAGASTWNTLWDIQATIEDSRTGAEVTVRAGTRVLLSQAQKQSVCP